MQKFTILQFVAVIFLVLPPDASGMQQVPNFDVNNTTYTIEGIEFSVSPSKPVFIQTEPHILDGRAFMESVIKPVYGKNEPVIIVVQAHNTTNEKRFLGISKTSENSSAQKNTFIQIDGKKIEIDGIPGYGYKRNNCYQDVRRK